MRETGRPGRGERGRIAAQVRALLGDPDPTGPVERDVPSSAEAAWLPGEVLDLGDLARPPERAARAPERSAASSAATSSAPPRPSVPVPPVSSAFGVRWLPERRALTAVTAAVLVAGLITAWWVLSARPRHLAVQASPAGAITASTAPSGTARATSASGPPAAPVTGSASGTASAALVVDVAGKVRRPGVYRLAAGARVIDAVRAAGGLRHGVSANSLNLAARLQDGEQILVGVSGSPGGAAAGAQAGAAGGSGSSGTGATGPVNLNAATLEQLETLPGVGPVLAQRILDWRTQHGGFNSVEQLDEVSGIGPAKFAQLRDAVTL